MDQAIRNKLRSVVTQCRRLLEESIAQQLQGKYDIYATGKKDEVKADDGVPLGHLGEEEREARRDILAHFRHIEALGYKPKESLEQLIREIAFTHLNRLCAYKMMEVRDVYVGGQRFRESVSKGLKSQGFLFYLADHPDDEKRYNAGDQETAYRHFLNWLGGTLSQEIGVLFSPTDPANRVYPPQRVLDEVLDLLNSEELKGIWSEDETIGWVYQYFTPKELRDQARKESQAPRNSYELAFRNQFFTPRYVVEFLTDNTLGRIWYEMRKGNTRLKDECRYMVRRPGEVFFSEKENEPDSPVQAMRESLVSGTEESFPPFEAGEIGRLLYLAHTVDGYERHPFEDQVEGMWWPWAKLREIRDAEDLTRFPAQDLLDVLFCQARADRHGGGSGDWEPVFYAIANEIRRRSLEGRNEDATQEQLLRAVTAIPHRPKKDPREIKILDPACGSGHFLLYCFALLLVIYEEAYDDHDLGPGLQADYPSRDELRRAVPGLILRHNLHGIDIDLRCTQIAALALWLRCQRAYQEAGLKKDRPPILKANVVCAEPMPGEKALLDEFLKTLREDRLEALIRQVLNVPDGKRVRATKGMAESLADLVHTVWDRMRLAGEAGSLLKIEEELQEAIRKGQDEWEERMPLFRFTEFGLSDEPRERLVRFVPGDVEGERITFWDKAESLVRKALDEFVRFASKEGRFQRQLFVEDAQQGLGFVDVCRGSYDLVLMNPPFGDCTSGAKGVVETHYPRTKNDLYSAFIERGLGRTNRSGMLGAITPRTGFFLSRFQKWREEVLLKCARVTAISDLGYNVLDTAMVETAAYCLQKDDCSQAAVFLRLLQAREKSEALLQTISSLNSGGTIAGVFQVVPHSFRQVSGSPFAYWVGERVRRLFGELPGLEQEGRSVPVGLQTSDDFRFLRCWWEVPASSLLDGVAGPDWRDNLPKFQEWCRSRTFQGKRWVPFAKGGEYAPYYADLHLVVDWGRDGEEMKEFARQLRMRQDSPSGLGPLREFPFYFRPGLTWPRRTNSWFGIRVLPAGGMFADKGPAIMAQHDDYLVILGFLFSQPYQLLIDTKMASADETQSGTQSRSYEVGVIASLPWPQISPDTRAKAAAATSQIVDAVRSREVHNEINHSFIGVPHCGSTLNDVTFQVQRRNEWAAVKGIEFAALIEEMVESTLLRHAPHALPPLAGNARTMIASQISSLSDDFAVRYQQSIHETIREELDEQGGNRQVAVNSFYLSRHLEVLAQTLNLSPRTIVQAASQMNLLPLGAARSTTEDHVSFCLGASLGRWDVRTSLRATVVRSSPDPFDPLPVCSPAMLIGSDGLPTVVEPPEYPLHIAHDGIIVDDSDHADDIIRRVRDALEVIWKDRSDAIEKEACEILGVADLRDYFRKPGAGGFWDDHIKRYSKSRRKAPIYWLLQSSKKNYALWIYYHRLDKDILFKALLNYVEPKVRREETRLDELRSQKTALGPAAKGAKKIDKDIDRQEAFLSELRDFEEKLRRVANLHLEPDLNDGVVLNIAPLRELVPWKEAKAYWDDLMDGKYEWSSIGKQLREKGLVR